MLEPCESLSSKNKRSKNKRNNRIEFQETKGTGYLIIKKDKGLKCAFQMKFYDTIYFICPLHFSHLSFNSILPFKEYVILPFKEYVIGW
jgi:hypothetical protein